jgi:hypothetical protein
MNTYTHVGSELQADAMAKLDGVLDPVGVPVGVLAPQDTDSVDERVRRSGPDQGV